MGNSLNNDEWEIHLTMTINFFLSKDSEETRTMYSKSDNIKLKTFLILFYKDTKKI